MIIKAVFQDAMTKVRGNGRETFNVRDGVHQDSVLSPLLLIIELEALSREFREGLPMELLYVCNFVPIAKTGIATGKIEEIEEGDESEGSWNGCW